MKKKKNEEFICGVILKSFDGEHSLKNKLNYENGENYVHTLGTKFAHIKHKLKNGEILIWEILLRNSFCSTGACNVSGVCISLKNINTFKSKATAKQTE